MRHGTAARLAACLLLVMLAAEAAVPALPDLPGHIQKRYRDPLAPEWDSLRKEREGVVKEGRALNAECANVEKGSAKHHECLGRAERFMASSAALRPRMEALDEAICVAKVLSEVCAGAAPAEPGNPERLPRHILKQLKAEYDELRPQWQSVTRQATEFCAKSPGALAKESGCANLKAGFATERFAYARREEAYRERLAKARRMFPLPKYQEYDHGLILGLTATGGFNVPPGSSDEMRKGAEKSFIDQQHKIQEGPAVSAQGYDFVLGMAKAPEIALHAPQELLRGLMDNAYVGAFSAYTRELYPSIKARSFDRLECHSNGAMVCLEALKQGDLAAREVKLFGPQVTTTSLTMWEQFLNEERVEKVDVYWLEADPIPLVALAIDPRHMLEAPQTGMPTQRTTLERLLSKAPAIRFHVLSCPQFQAVSLKNPFACHRVQLYQMGVSEQ